MAPVRRYTTLSARMACLLIPQRFSALACHVVGGVVRKRIEPYWCS